MRKARGIGHRLRQCEDGTAAIEFAIIGMVLIMLVLGTIELGRGLYLYNKLSHATDLAARKALIKPDITDNMLRDEILSTFSAEGAALTVNVESGFVGSGKSKIEYKTVKISLPFTPLIPGLVGDTFKLNTVRTIPLLP